MAGHSFRALLVKDSLMAIRHLCLVQIGFLSYHFSTILAKGGHITGYSFS